MTDNLTALALLGLVLLAALTGAGLAYLILRWRHRGW